MTYFGVLATFILPPLIILAIFVPKDLWQWVRNRQTPLDRTPYVVLAAHVFLALVYTTPWDNYLVATQVWWYNPALVTGITLGYVPIEEYTFFVVQTLLTGLWTIALLRKFAPSTHLVDRPGLRTWASILTGGGAVGFTLLLFVDWVPGTYLALILSWGLLPVLLQVWFGADILLHNWRSLILSVGVPTIYLWVVDYLAINSGTWIIDPVQTTGIKLGVLPMEEMVFFFMTNLIIGFGITLMLSKDSQPRASKFMQALKRS